MGMTLWIHTLEGRAMSGESDDHSLMHRLADELDSVCKERGLPLLSGYFDFTDLNHNMDEQFDDEGDYADDAEEPSLDAETGLAYGIDDMQWFDAAEGLKAIDALRGAVESGALPQLAEPDRKELLGELRNCGEVLRGPAGRGARFHLAVVM